MTLDNERYAFSHDFLFHQFFQMSYPMNSLCLKKIIMQVKEFEEGWDLLNYAVVYQLLNYNVCVLSL